MHKRVKQMKNGEMSMAVHTHTHTTLINSVIVFYTQIKVKTRQGGYTR